jgi:hypothetical protein
VLKLLGCSATMVTVAVDVTTIDETFASLDPDRWFRYYLPHWSSKEQARARFDLADGLRLRIEPDQNLWCADLHEEPLRVSGIQSAARVGQQPFRDGLVVGESYPEFIGFAPRYGEVAITMSGVVSSRSMFAAWLAGIEDEPDHAGEICIAEIFGSDVHANGADVGIGIKKLGDPALDQDFSTIPLDLDVTEQHTYSARWWPGRTEFSVDGVEVRQADQAPDYPLQLMIGVFDFPDKAQPDDTRLPEMRVTRVTGSTWRP